MKPKINPEFLPLIEWWEKDGKQYVSGILIAAVVVGGWYAWKNHRASVAADASASVASAFTTEELETAVSKHSGSAAGGVLRIRLAKSYFDAGRYEEALATYDALVANPPDGFADIPVVGRAQCLEALSRFDEASREFDAFAEANPSNYLALSAQIGAVRCIAQAGDIKKALDRIEAMKAANKDDSVATARIEAAEDVVKRYVKPAPAAKPAPELKAVPDPAAKPVPELKAAPAPAAKPAPAPAAKPAAKPAPAPAAKPAAKPAPAPAAKPAEAKK